MTPEEAQTLLDRLEYAGNVDDPVYAEVDEAIIPMLETIAGMQWEYAVVLRDSGTMVTEWAPEEPLFPGQSISENERIVRRLVSAPEEIA